MVDSYKAFPKAFRVSYPFPRPDVDPAFSFPSPLSPLILMSSLWHYVLFTLPWMSSSISVLKIQFLFGLFVKNQVSVDVWSYIWIFILFHQQVCFYANTTLAFIIIAAYYNLKSGKLIPPAVLFSSELFQIFHLWMCVSIWSLRYLLTSVKNYVGVLMRISMSP